MTTNLWQLRYLVVAAHRCYLWCLVVDAQKTFGFCNILPLTSTSRFVVTAHLWHMLYCCNMPATFVIFCYGRISTTYTLFSHIPAILTILRENYELTQRERHVHEIKTDRDRLETGDRKQGTDMGYWADTLNECLSSCRGYKHLRGIGLFVWTSLKAGK